MLVFDYRLIVLFIKMTKIKEEIQNNTNVWTNLLVLKTNTEEALPISIIMLQ